MKSTSNPVVPSTAIFVSLIAINMAQITSAATGTWSGVFDGIWDTTDANWIDVSGTPWDLTNGPDNTAIFNTASLAAVVSAPVFTNGITFSTTGALSGDTINLVGTTPGIAVATGQSGTISAAIAGTAGIVKSDAGLLTLSNATFTGGTTVSGGRLVLENTMTGSPNYTTDAELEFHLSTDNQQLQSGTFNGNGKLIKSGGNELMLGNWPGPQTVALTGAASIIDVQGGTLNTFYNFSGVPTASWSGNEAGLTVASGATFQIRNANVVLDELNGFGTINKGAFDLNNTLTIGVRDGSGNFGGNLSDADPTATLALVKQGSGTQTLSGTITYRGGTTVNGGRLVLENTKTGNQSYTTNAELEFNLSIGNLQFQGGTFSGTGKLMKTGGDELILSNWGGAQTVALTGADSVIDVQAGKLSNFAPASAPPTNWSGNRAGLKVASGATFEINNTSTIVDELSGAGTINKGTWDTAVTLTIGVNDGSGTFSGVIAQPVGTALSIVKQGSGTQTLSGSSSYGGTTTIDGGTLALGTNNVLPGTAVSIGNATLDAATFTDTVGTLDVTAAATINLGDNGKLVFANSNGVDWTGGTLNITGSFVSSSSIKFATSGGLDFAQLDAISVNGSGPGSCSLDPNGFLVVSSSDPYAGWATGGEPFDGDANGDGVQDGLAWLLGAGTPATNALNKLPEPARNGAFLTLDFQRVNPYSPTKLFVQFGNDLSGWTEVEIPASSGTVTLPGDDVEVEVIGGSPDEVTVKIPTSYQSASGALFARLRASNN